MSHRSPRRPLAGRVLPLLVLLPLVAACGATTGTGASTGPSAATGASPTAPSPSPVPSASPTPEPSVDLHGAPELEARLLDSVAGTTLSKFSLTGEDFLKTGTGPEPALLTGMLGQLGKTPADLTIAEAHDPSGVLVFDEGLFRVAGADPDRLLAAWIAAQQAAVSGRLQVSQTTVGSTAMTRLLDPTKEEGGSTYALAKGDTIYLILADDPTVLQDAVGQL